MNQKFEKLAGILKNEEVLSTICKMSAVDAASFIGKEYEIEISSDEMEDVFAGIKAAYDENEELSEDTLDLVAGGKNSIAYNCGYYVGKAVKAVKLFVDLFGK